MRNLPCQVRLGLGPLHRWLRPGTLPACGEPDTHTFVLEGVKAVLSSPGTHLGDTLVNKHRETCQRWFIVADVGNSRITHW